MLFVITGDGKGKTTSCIGHMVRAVGQGKRACMFQFIKGPWVSGEHRYVEELSEEQKESFLIVRGGKGFVGIEGDELPFEEHVEAAENTLMQVKDAIGSGKWDMIVLDEVHVALSLELLKEEDILDVLDMIPDDMVCITSGRGASGAIVDRADVVSRIDSVFHHYDEGKSAQRGFDF